MARPGVRCSPGGSSRRGAARLTGLLSDTTVPIVHLRGALVSQRLVEFGSASHSPETSCVDGVEVALAVRSQDRAASKALPDRLLFFEASRGASVRPARDLADFERCGKAVRSVGARRRPLRELRVEGPGASGS